MIGAFEVHGLSRAFLQDKPLFADICDELIAFIKDAELVIHNAPFDVSFLDYEFKRVQGAPRVNDLAQVKDSLAVARVKNHPGQKKQPRCVVQTLRSRQFATSIARCTA